MAGACKLMANQNLSKFIYVLTKSGQVTDYK
jgi:hypothetical protein